MTREVIVKQPALPGLVPDIEAATIAKAYHAKIEDYGQGKLALPELPSAQERAILEQRFSGLTRALRPISYAVADRERAMLAFGRLFLGYPTLENVDKMEKSATYAIDLADLPAFAIEAAVEDVKKNRVKDLDPDYPPSSPRMYTIAEGHRDAVYAKEHRPIERVLSVRMLSKPKQTEAETTRVADLMRGLADGMRSDIEHEDRQHSKARMAKAMDRNQVLIAREWARLGLEPKTSTFGGKTTMLSVSLARSLGLIPVDSPPPGHPNAPGRR